MWQREELLQPIDAIGGPAMNGRRAVTPAQNATHRDHDDVHEQMFTIARSRSSPNRFRNAFSTGSWRRCGLTTATQSG